MIDYSLLYDQLAGSELGGWASSLPDRVARVLDPASNGDLPGWLAALERLPPIIPSLIDLKVGALRIGESGDCSDEERASLEAELRAFHPWRKGPFNVMGIPIDTEWRSDWKWDRVAPHIAGLSDRTILDVGCGNGYFGWRMLGAGAKLVIGIDHFPLYTMQYHALHHFMPHLHNYVLPLSIDDLPRSVVGFDTAFSMGVLYHVRSPLDHIQRLWEMLRPGGELVLETLVIQGSPGEVLSPPGRYARMRNVWFIPNIDVLQYWVQRSGFYNARVVDVTPTTVEEQRRTEWMTFESLEACLDPEDHAKTVEGWPAPLRAVVLANKPA